MEENRLAGEHELNALAHPQDDESVEDEDVE
jgi:hypothetical protein